MKMCRLLAFQPNRKYYFAIKIREITIESSRPTLLWFNHFSRRPLCASLYPLNHRPSMAPPLDPSATPLDPSAPAPSPMTTVHTLACLTVSAWGIKERSFSKRTTSTRTISRTTSYTMWTALLLLVQVIPSARQLVSRTWICCLLIEMQNYYTHN